MWRIRVCIRIKRYDLFLWGAIVLNKHSNKTSISYLKEKLLELCLDTYALNNLLVL